MPAGAELAGQRIGGLCFVAEWRKHCGRCWGGHALSLGQGFVQAALCRQVFCCLMACLQETAYQIEGSCGLMLALRALQSLEVRCAVSGLLAAGARGALVLGMLPALVDFGLVARLRCVL